MSYISAVKKNETVFVWERDNDGNRVTKSYPAPFYFYSGDKNGKHTSLYGEPLERYDFTSDSEFYNTRKKAIQHGYDLYESDIPPELKILSEHYYNVPAPKLNVTFYDIEVDYDTSIGFSSPSNPYAAVNAIAMFHTHKNQMVVIAIPPKDANCDVPDVGVAGEDYIKKMNDITPIIDGVDIVIEFYKTEKEVLERFLLEIEDTDLICGWNNSGFDDPYMGKRLELMGKKYFNKMSFVDAPNPKWKMVEIFGKEQPVIELFGRVSLDYLTLFKKYMIENQPSYKLDNIADKFLRTDGKPDMPKLEYEGSLARLYKDDFDYFIRYNIRDTEILFGFENKLKYVALANEMVHLSTGLFQHVAGTIKLHELSVINYCHHEMGGVIVNDKRDNDWGEEKIKGAIVLDPVTGMHEWSSSIDLNSLYPSVIRANNISPETKIGQFKLEEAAVDHIRRKSDTQLIFEKVNGKIISKTGADWRKYLLDHNWCISGFGTVFNMNKQGVVPKILEDWYAKRKTYQKQMIEAKDAAAKILEKYK